MGEGVREFLAERDARCPSCGYNLRGLSGDACPECGWVAVLAELQEKEAFRTWRESRMPNDPITTSGLIGSILSLGWPAAVMVMGLAARDRHALDAGRLLVLAVVGGVQVGLVAVYLGNLAGMKSWPRRRKVGMAVLAWGWGPGALLMVLLWMILG